MTGTQTRSDAPAAPVPPAATPGPGGRWWLVAGSVLLVATLAWGGLQVVELLARQQRTETTRVDAHIAEVHIDGHRGSVRVIAGSGSSTVLTERISQGLRPGSRSVDVVGDRLVATSSCPAFVNTWCSVSYVVEVPEGTVVNIRTRHGDLRVSGPVGPVSVSTRHGDVSIDGAAGVVDVETRHGDVDIVTSEVPDRVRAVTRHGDVDLVVPDSPDSYLVELSTRNGETVNGVRSDPTSERLIDLSTRHGDVVVRYGP